MRQQHPARTPSCFTGTTATGQPICRPRSHSPCLRTRAQKTPTTTPRQGATCAHPCHQDSHVQQGDQGDQGDQTPFLLSRDARPGNRHLASAGIQGSLQPLQALRFFFAASGKDQLFARLSPSPVLPRLAPSCPVLPRLCPSVRLSVAHSLPGTHTSTQVISPRSQQAAQSHTSHSPPLRYPAPPGFRPALFRSTSQHSG